MSGGQIANIPNLDNPQSKSEYNGLLKPVSIRYPIIIF